MLRYRFTKKHLTDSEISRYRRRKMRPDELAAASDHLAACAECFQRFEPTHLVAEAYELARNSLESAPESHLLYEELAGYSDGTLGEPEREAAERHLAACEECEADLQSFFDLSALINRRDQEPQISTAPVVGDAPTFWERLRGGWQALPRLNYRGLVQATSLAAVVVLIIWGVTRPTQKQVDELTSEIQQLRAENDSMREAEAKSNAQIAELIKQNERVQQGEDLSRMAVRLNDGIGQVALDESGTIQGLQALPVELRTDVETALTSERLQIAAGPVVKIGRVGTLLGEGETETFKLITPVGSIVLSNLPAFKWEALPGATSYTVLIRDVETGREIESEQLSGTQWTPKEPLARGHTYAWMVEAIKDGKRLRAPALNQPYAGFKVLEKRVFDNIQRAQASWGHSHLVMGIVYAKAGLKDAARKELKELQAANPDVRIINRFIKSLDSKR